MTTLVLPLSTLSKLLDVCTEIKNGQRDNELGLCYNICMCWPGAERDDIADWLSAQFPLWENYSGSLAYPVPDPDHFGSPEAAALIFLSITDTCYIGRYGELRLHLLDFLYVQTLTQLRNAFNISLEF